MAKTARAKVDRRKTPPAPAAAAAAPASVSEEAIARRAFEYYCARGNAHGQDLDDWFQAERELLTSVQGSA